MADDPVRTPQSHVVHCPESNMKLGSGQCRIRALVHAGVNVALGTDGAASNDDHDLFGEMRTAVLLDRLGGGGAALDAHEILAMATINGARALGIEDTTGSLAVGKAADIVAVRVLNEPVYDPIATLVYVGTNRYVECVSRRLTSTSHATGTDYCIWPECRMCGWQARSCCETAS